VHVVQALRLCTGRTAHRGSRSIALLFLDHGTRRGEWSAVRLSRTLPPGKTRYPLYRRLGEPQGQSGQVRKLSPPTRFNPRTVQPVANKLYIGHGRIRRRRRQVEELRIRYWMLATRDASYNLWIGRQDIHPASKAIVATFLYLETNCI